MKRPTLAAFLTLAVAGCGGGDARIGDDPAETGPKLPYDVKVETAGGGTLPEGLESYLSSVSKAAAATDRPPSNLLVLRTRAEDDLPRLLQGLRAQGYYEGKAAYRIVQDRDRLLKEDGTTDTPAEVGAEIQKLIEGAPTRLVYEVTPGPRFRFAERGVRVEGGAKGYAPPNVAGDLGIKQGEPALAQTVLDAEKTLLDDAKNDGRAFAKLGDRRAVVDLDANTMDVTLAIEPGPVVAMQRPTIMGDGDLDEKFLRTRMGIEPGQTFSLGAIDAARQSLVNTNLFSVVRVRSGDAVGPDGRLPVTAELTQRQHRTIGGGLGYYTDTGPEVRAFWENRNLFNAGEKLRFDATWSQVDLSADLTFRKPDIGRVRDLDLVADASVGRENTDAYDARSIGGGVGLERRFDAHTTGTLGLSYRFVRISDELTVGNTNYGLLSLPGTLRLDYADSLLDPSKGWRLTLKAAPYLDTLGVGTHFFKAQAVGTAYLRLMNEPRLVLAFKAGAGTIAGADREEVPADERFYAGGGGSVRGIPYQLAGPLEDGEPTGGLSLLETGAELRYRAFENVEFAAFVDAGSAFDSTAPSFDDARVGYGLGARYLTPVGPIRLDVAFPLNKRDVDDSFQFYISIGQAF
ncbi:MAG: outer membrane protein assembly factor [Geminicoccaceae bacterium]|nr:outer membrane protein assembly factor [Geminicoccaceae bacterium]